MHPTHPSTPSTPPLKQPMKNSSNHMLSRSTEAIDPKITRRRATCVGLGILLLAGALSTIPTSVQAGPFESRLHHIPYNGAFGQWTGALVAVEFVNAQTGMPFPLFGHNGRGMLRGLARPSIHVGGNNGSPYTIRLRNLTRDRILVVVSVDGVNVVSGETASASQGGYVIDGHGVTTIDGWRKSMSEVAQFVFSSPGESYAAQTGRARNVGVIGVAAFKEEAPPVQILRQDHIRNGQKSFDSADMGGNTEKGGYAIPERQARSAESASSLGGASIPATRSIPSTPGLGTAHGDRQGSEVSQTTFKRSSSNPDEVVTVAYDTMANLVARGIAVRRYEDTRGEPKAFPADRSDGFVTDPPRR